VFTQQVPELSGFTALQKLELSYNRIHSLAQLTSLGSMGLRELYAANNAIQQIEVCNPSMPKTFFHASLGTDKAR
jgi:Leucine-rich repeat (LRR) protein